MRGGASVSTGMPPRQWFVAVERAAAAIRFRVFLTRPGGERVAVENAGVGIVPIEVLGSGDHDGLKEAYHVFRELPLRDSSSEPTRLAEALSVWREALAARRIDLRIEREALYGEPLPRTSWMEDSRGISLRPRDIELTALAADLRRVVKFDRVPRNLIEDLQRDALERGLLVEVVVPEDGATGATLLISRDTEALAEGRSLEQRLLARGSLQTAEGASARMGDLLGYPRCCAERFARVTEHNDTNLAWALLPGLCDPAPPFTQWLQPGLALLSHSPCGLTCRPSVELGRHLLDAVDAAEPGFATRWHTLAARLQVVDRYGNRLALAVEGSLREPARVVAADGLAAGGPDPEAAERTKSLVGKQIQAELGGVTTPESDWYAPYAADHRGAMLPD